MARRSPTTAKPSGSARKTRGYTCIAAQSFAEGDFDKANADVKAALALDPKSNEALGLDEWIKQLAGKKAEGLRTAPQSQKPEGHIDFQNLGDIFK